MSNIIPFTAGAKLPAYMANREALALINMDVVRAASFGVLSIKGKVFTLVKGVEKKILSRTDEEGDEVPVASVQLAVLRANTKSRVLYLKEYTEGESDGSRPDCSSDDGIVPRADSVEPQAKKCAICPHAVWGTGNDGKGTKCSVNTRLAVTDPDKLEEPLLLRVPAGSKKNFADAVKMAETRGIPYNALVMKVGFDPAAPSPRLTFKLTGLLDDASYEKASALYEDEVVRDIVGLGHAAPAAESGADDAAALDAAIAARAAEKATAEKKAANARQSQAKLPPAEALDTSDLDAALSAEPEPAKPAAKAVKPKAEKPKVEAKPEPKPEPHADMTDTDGDLLGDIDALLGAKDD